MTATTLAQLSPSHFASSGNWNEDNAIGRAAALRLIAYARTNGETGYLFSALRNLAKADRCSGIEVGFAQAIAEACIR